MGEWSLSIRDIYVALHVDSVGLLEEATSKFPAVKVMYPVNALQNMELNELIVEHESFYKTHSITHEHCPPRSVL